VLFFFFPFFLPFWARTNEKKAIFCFGLFFWGTADWPFPFLPPPFSCGSCPKEGCRAPQLPFFWSDDRSSPPLFFFRACLSKWPLRAWLTDPASPPPLSCSLWEFSGGKPGTVGLFPFSRLLLPPFLFSPFRQAVGCLGFAVFPFPPGPPSRVTTSPPFFFFSLCPFYGRTTTQRTSPLFDPRRSVLYSFFPPLGLADKKRMRRRCVFSLAF